MTYKEIENYLECIGCKTIIIVDYREIDTEYGCKLIANSNPTKEQLDNLVKGQEVKLNNKYIQVDWIEYMD